VEGNAFDEAKLVSITKAWTAGEGEGGKAEKILLEIKNALEIAGGRCLKSRGGGEGAQGVTFGEVSRRDCFFLHLSPFLLPLLACFIAIHNSIDLVAINSSQY